jgi:hypothetical protein
MKKFITFIFLLNGILFGRVDRDLVEKFERQLQPKSMKVRFLNIGQNI